MSAPTKPAPPAPPAPIGVVPSWGPLRSIAALVLREMTATYGRSAGGYVWAILQPVGTLAVLTLGFSLLVRSPPLGTTFVLFYATGYLPFQMYANAQQVSQGALRYSRALLAYPRVAWIDAVLARVLLTAITGAAVFVIIMAGIFAVFHPRTSIEIAPVLGGFAICLMVGVGVGMCNCWLEARFPIWQQLWSIVSRPLFLASGLFYIYEDLGRGAQAILQWNPLFHATSFVRAGFYPSYHAVWASPAYAAGIGLALVAAGLALLRHGHADVLER